MYKLLEVFKVEFFIASFLSVMGKDLPRHH